MDTSQARDRTKVIESIALRNKIYENINGIKEDIALLKEILGKIIDICRTHDTFSSTNLNSSNI